MTKYDIYYFFSEHSDVKRTYSDSTTLCHVCMYIMFHKIHPSPSLTLSLFDFWSQIKQMKTDKFSLTDFWEILYVSVMKDFHLCLLRYPVPVTYHQNMWLVAFCQVQWIPMLVDCTPASIFLIQVFQWLGSQRDALVSQKQSCLESTPWAQRRRAIFLQ